MRNLFKARTKIITYISVGLLATIVGINVAVFALGNRDGGPQSNLRQQLINELMSYNPGRLSQFKTPVSDGVRQALLILQHPILTPPGGTSSVANPALGPVPSSQHIFTRDESGLPQNEQAVAVSGSTVVVASNDYRNYLTFLNRCRFGNGSGCNGIFEGTGIDVSHDGGLTISNDLLGPINPNVLGGLEGDPGVAISNHGAIYVSSLNFSAFGCDTGVVLWKSTDGGTTFTPTTSPVQFTGFNACGVFVDKDALAVDTTSNAATAGNIYITWTNSSASSDNIAVAASHDGGKSWTRHSLTNSSLFYQFSYAAVGPDGTVYVTYADYHNAVNSFLFGCLGLSPRGFSNVTSTTTSKNTNVTTVTTTRTSNVTTTTTTTSKPTCNPGYGPVFIMLTKSTDGGRTWSRPTIAQRVDKPLTWPFFTPLADQFFPIATQPKIAVDNSATSTRGTVYISWEDLSAGRQVQLGACASSSQIQICKPGSKGSAIWVVHSSNQGKTWSSPIVASPCFCQANLFDSYMPWLSVDSSNGHLAVAYYTSEPDPYNHRLYIGIATSSDRGNTFSQRMLPQFYEPSVEGFFGGFFWGDYLGAAAQGGQVAIAYTGDARETFGWFEQDPYLATVSD
jgi:hypothetical protein